MVPPFDEVAAAKALATAVRQRLQLPLPIAASEVSRWSDYIRIDGLSRYGQPALLVTVNRQMQDQLLLEPTPVLHAIHGVMEHIRKSVFTAGGPETVMTVVHVGRGFRLSWSAMPLKAIQELMSALQDLYPNYTQAILVVNLPPYLMWFVRFIKGLLCEVTAKKLELATDEVSIAFAHIYTHSLSLFHSHTHAHTHARAHVRAHTHTTHNTRP